MFFTDIVKAHSTKAISLKTAQTSQKLTGNSAHPPAMATLKIESNSTQYKILNNPSDNEAFLERVSTQISNKTIKIPKGLAQSIKSDLLNLSWQTQYKSNRDTSKSCTIAARINLEAEDEVRFCSDQKTEMSKIHQIQKNLDELIESKK